MHRKSELELSVGDGCVQVHEGWGGSEQLCRAAESNGGEWVRAESEGGHAVCNSGAREEVPVGMCAGFSLDQAITIDQAVAGGSLLENDAEPRVGTICLRNPVTYGVSCVLMSGASVRATNQMCSWAPL